MENNDLANTTTQDIGLLDGLAAQARALRTSINVNLWQLAKVFIEAKRICPHGEWEKWLEDNAEVSVRTAQQMMQTYEKFGGIPQIGGLGKAKLFRMLPLPDKAVTEFLENNDVENMSTRDVEAAVKKVREEADAEIRKAKEDAERRIQAAEKQKNAPSAELRSEISANRVRMQKQEEEIERLTKAGVLAAEEAAKLRRRLQEQDGLLEEQQEELNRAQQELLNMQSAAARGEDRPITDQLTLETFSMAVNGFVGTCSRMPLMRESFAAMGHEERQEYRLLLETVEKWARDSRRAMELDVIEGGASYV